MKTSGISRTTNTAAVLTTALALGLVGLTAPLANADSPSPGAAGAASAADDYPSPGQGPTTSGSGDGSLAASIAAAQPITRSEVLKRAATWVGLGLPYNMGGSYQGWRTDCSGYVSMAWGLPGPGRATPEFLPSGVAHAITKDELKPGDALNNDHPDKYGHIVLFEKWTDASKSAYWGYEFSGTGVHHRVIPYAYFSRSSEYQPIRLDNIVDDEQTPAAEDGSRVKGDFDGDGRDDVAVLYDYGREGGRSHSGLWTFSSNGSGFNSPKKAWDSGSDSWNWASSKLTVGDFNGDGRADIAALYDMGRSEDGRNRTKLFTFTNNGNGFSAPEKVWDSQEDAAVKSWNWSASKLGVGDFNGDGKADVGVLYDYGSTEGGNRTGLWTFTSTGSGFVGPKKLWDSNDDPVKSWNWSASKLSVGDFNGDGKADVGVLYDYDQTDKGNRTGLWTFTSTGVGFNSPKKVWDSEGDPVKSWNWDVSKPVTGDFNGDGKADIGVLYDYGPAETGNHTGLWTFTSTGSGFNSPKKLWDSNDDPVKSWNWDASKPVTGDFNGDGKADIGVLYDYGRTHDVNRSGLWTFTSTGSGFSSPRLGWDSQSDAVKSWSWAASKTA
ncbi:MULTISPECIES: C40 family peptidase [unclassified Streptomyces]|uniref:C40 family peptidase n=1 Tax=unclassified Streptomyces TaxID=2593676 RepID=UPI002E2EB1C8|nr:MULTISPECIES: FG-GAP-like repeat-containing protein [unclassified Streptomyces]